MRNAENLCLRMTRMIEQLQRQILCMSAFSREVKETLIIAIPQNYRQYPSALNQPTQSR